MRAILRTNDAVMLSYAQSVLDEAGIQTLIFDTHASIMDGSMGMVPRRLMVPDDDFTQAQRLLREAIPGGPVES
jgi:hypothetical protein